jgi:hypothetical protein
MLHFLASGTGGWEWLIFGFLPALLSVVVLIAYVISSATDLVKKKEKPALPPWWQILIVLALVTVFLGALFVMRDPNWEMRWRYEPYVAGIVLGAPVLLCFCVVFVFRKKKRLRE